jgi:mannosylglycerate synthase
MDSMIVLPFKQEDPDVLRRTIDIAAHHPSVSRVQLIGSQPNRTYDVAVSAAEAAAAQTSTRVEVILQERIGQYRSGKGDAMLTGLKAFLDQPEQRRLHFYDTDIVTFGPDWIDLAETGLDEGADVVRHYFHRPSTDAQITWHITRLGAALNWPGSLFPHIRQPLGGELALTRAAATLLWEDQDVRRQSDWGIDTALTFGMCRHQLAISEVFVPQGKVHGFYNGLADLRTMLIECFGVIQRLGDKDLPSATGADYRVQPSELPSPSITDIVAYDDAKTRQLLALPLSAAERFQLRQLLGMNVTHWPAADEMDDGSWSDFLQVALLKLDVREAGAADLLFRAWSGRVLFHTLVNVPKGFGPAHQALQDVIESHRNTITR